MVFCLKSLLFLMFVKFSTSSIIFLNSEEITTSPIVTKSTTTELVPESKDDILCSEIINNYISLDEVLTDFIALTKVRSNRKVGFIIVKEVCM